jgi:hypothetical protein
MMAKKSFVDVFLFDAVAQLVDLGQKWVFL